MLDPNDVVAPTAHIVPPPLATATAPHKRPFVSVAIQVHEVPRTGGCVPCTGAMCITQPVIRGGTYHIGMSAQSSMKTPTHQVSSFAPSLSIGALLRVIAPLLTRRPCWQRLCGKMDGERPQDQTESWTFHLKSLTFLCTFMTHMYLVCGRSCPSNSNFATNNINWTQSQYT